MGTAWRSSDDSEWTVWGGEGVKYSHPRLRLEAHRSTSCTGSTWMWFMTSIKWCTKSVGCHKHLTSFCLVSTAVSVLSDLNCLILKSGIGRIESYLSFLPLTHYTFPSHPSYIGWRMFRLVFGTCLLYPLRVRCCQVSNIHPCHLLTFYIGIFVSWFLK